MPWQTQSLVEQREEFVKRTESWHEYFSHGCPSVGVSRVTGYKWLARYRDSCRGAHLARR
jgi:hypothetical protein